MDTPTWPMKVFLIIAFASSPAALPVTRTASVEEAPSDSKGGPGHASSPRRMNSKSGRGSYKGGNLGHSKAALDRSDGPRNKPAVDVQSALSQDRRPNQNQHMRMYLTPCLARIGEDLAFQMKSTKETISSGSAGPMRQSDKCSVHSCKDPR